MKGTRLSLLREVCTDDWRKKICKTNKVGNHARIVDDHWPVVKADGTQRTADQCGSQIRLPPFGC